MTNATRPVNMYEITDPKCYTTFTVDDQCVLIDRTSNNGNYYMTEGFPFL